MTSVGLGEMFEGDSADMCAGKFRRERKLPPFYHSKNTEKSNDKFTSLHKHMFSFRDTNTKCTFLNSNHYCPSQSDKNVSEPLW